jgi:hypothetical protein
MTSNLINSATDALAQAGSCRDMMVLVVGGSGSGKSKLLRSVSERAGCKLVSISEPLAAQLVEVPKKLLPLEVEAVMRELISQDGSAGCAVDNTDLLFSSALHVDPVRVLSAISRSHRMIVGLHGRMQGMRFIHAHSDHPEHRESEIRGIPVIDLNDPDPQFQIYV